MSADLIARLRASARKGEALILAFGMRGANRTTLHRMVATATEAASALEAAEARIASVRAESVEEWQPIETAPRDGTHALFFWPHIPESARRMGASAMMHHGVSIGWFEWDEDFEDRPKGWVSPKCGFRMEGDQCLARNQEDCRYWRPLPAPPAPKQEGA